MPWMEEVKRQLSEKVNIVQALRWRAPKRKKGSKNLTVPGIDGVQNYWWKNFEPARKALTKVYVLMKTVV